MAVQRPDARAMAAQIYKKGAANVVTSLRLMQKCFVSGLLCVGIAAAERINASFRINQLLLTSEERMAL